MGTPIKKSKMAETDIDKIGDARRKFGILMS